MSEPATNTKAAGPMASGVVVPRPLSWTQRVAASAALAAARMLMMTWRWRWQEPMLSPVTPGPVIFCTWHNRLAMAMVAYDRFAREHWPCAGMCAMISASRDGAFLARVLEPFGIIPIRGSSSRRGPQALLEATSWIEKNYSIAITPDGPRGPVYKVQEGVIYLAQLTGRPIIPMSNYVRWKYCFKSWDRFQFPLPFARCELRYGKPFFVPREISDEERAKLCRELEAEMRAITTD